jgi:PTS system mannose-specific IIA component
MSHGEGVRGFRIVVATHGDLGAAFLASAEMICGPIDDSRAVGLLPEHSPEAYAELLRDAVGEGPCLILADLAGGTPCNVAMLVARNRPNLVAIAGTNLGRVIEAATSLTSLDEPSIEQLVSAGRASVTNATGRLTAAGT